MRNYQNKFDSLDNKLKRPKPFLNFLKESTGFTLIEMLTSMFIFSLIIAITANIFISGLREQKRSLQSGQLLNQISYTLEYMSRALRMAKKDDGTCIGDKLNYKIEGNGIKFRNYKNECQKFYLDNGQLKEDKNGSVSELTSGDFNITTFRIADLGWLQPPADNIQPRVTIFLEIKPAGQESPKLQPQTTISQRNLDTQK